MNTVNLHYTEQGQGIPLILLHGFPLSSAIWNDQVRTLSDHYHVIAPDLRGHGQSPAPDGIYEMELMAQDVFKLLDTLAIDKAAIMGHSMGGYVALAAWRLHPERFLALGLIGSHAWADTEETRQNRLTQAEKVFIEGSGVIAEAMMPKLFAPSVPADELFREQVRNIMLSTRPSGVMGTLRGMAARPDLSTLLPNMDMPVLILVGDSDPFVSIQRAETMAAAIIDATLVTIENAGHMPMLEQPQATALAIRNFLAVLNPHR